MTQPTPLRPSPWSTNGWDDAPAGPPLAASARRLLPDVAQDTTAHVPGQLDWVGMSGIEAMLRRRDPRGHLVLTPARVDAYVNLIDPAAKGIHMSRLYLATQSALDAEEFGLPLLRGLLARFVDSHEGLSDAAHLSVAFEHAQRREALLSEHSAWRLYPTRVTSEWRGGAATHCLEVRVTYSSACPCSAALAQQLLQERFVRAFSGHSWVGVAHVSNWLGSREAAAAIPHSQRSHADVRVRLAEENGPLPLAALIELAEAALATPVQGAVKRADEQEFARLNGDNLMFCEDAARRLRAALEAFPGLADYRVEVNHLESLHPHDARAVAVKGAPGGFRP